MDPRTSPPDDSPEAVFRPVAGSPPPPPPPGSSASPVSPGSQVSPGGDPSPRTLGVRPSSAAAAPSLRPGSGANGHGAPGGADPLRQNNPSSGLAAGILRAARPKQWTKNVLVFAAPGAAGVLFHGRPFLHTLAAFALFCAVASGTYLLNDAMDAPADRQHPVKRHRPVAAGIVSVRLAFILAAVFMGAGIALGALLRPQLGLVLGIYVVLQVAYSSYLKHQPVYDITCVAGGFLLRAIAGAVAIPVAVSEWFLIVTTFGSLLMVTGKRLAEHAELGEGRGGHRATLDAYSITFLRIVVAMSATGAVVGYSLWAFGLEAAAVAVHHHDGIFFQLSIVPVLLALLHFTLLIEQGHGARPEELVLGDRQLQILGALWVLLFALGVYG
ncbi:MAG TPA: decaprenyl-phosphate phosphoribosyltransferase [Acidimicrobiales bacterium]|nr:decaprenyl-phosphate phosphoribosyltransferase [Acidimicrobiales bacterium]